MAILRGMASLDSNRIGSFFLGTLLGVHVCWGSWGSSPLTVLTSPRLSPELEDTGDGTDDDWATSSLLFLSSLLTEIRLSNQSAEGWQIEGRRWYRPRCYYQSYKRCLKCQERCPSVHPPSFLLLLTRSSPASSAAPSWPSRLPF
jgi:hypothetical protein